MRKGGRHLTHFVTLRQGPRRHRRGCSAGMRTRSEPDDWSIIRAPGGPRTPDHHHRLRRRGPRRSAPQPPSPSRSPRPPPRYRYSRPPTMSAAGISGSRRLVWPGCGPGTRGGAPRSATTRALEARVLAKTRQKPPDGGTHWTPRKSAVDEKTAIQALDRLDPVQPLSQGPAERHGFESHRHGTLSLNGPEHDIREVLRQTVPRHTSAGPNLPGGASAPAPAFHTDLRLVALCPTSRKIRRYITAIAKTRRLLFLRSRIWVSGRLVPIGLQERPEP